MLDFLKNNEEYLDEFEDKLKDWSEEMDEILKEREEKASMYTPSEIAEGISPREGEIEEVLDETIAEQSRINNQDKEKEGEVIGAN